MTRTPLFKLKGQRSTCGGWGMWRPPAHLVNNYCLPRRSSTYRGGGTWRPPVQLVNM